MRTNISIQDGTAKMSKRAVKKWKQIWHRSETPLERSLSWALLNFHEFPTKRNWVISHRKVQSLTCGAFRLMSFDSFADVMNRGHWWRLIGDDASLMCWVVGHYFPQKFEFVSDLRHFNNLEVWNNQRQSSRNWFMIAHWRDWCSVRSTLQSFTNPFGRLTGY